MRMAVKSDYVFVNERGQPFARMGIWGNDRACRRGCRAALCPIPRSSVAFFMTTAGRPQTGIKRFAAGRRRLGVDRECSLGNPPRLLPP